MAKFTISDSSGLLSWGLSDNSTFVSDGRKSDPVLSRTSRHRDVWVINAGKQTFVVFLFPVLDTLLCDSNIYYVQQKAAAALINGFWMRWFQRRTGCQKSPTDTGKIDAAFLSVCLWNQMNKINNRLRHQEDFRRSEAEYLKTIHI